VLVALCNLLRTSWSLYKKCRDRRSLIKGGIANNDAIKMHESRNILINFSSVSHFKARHKIFPKPIHKREKKKQLTYGVVALRWRNSMRFVTVRIFGMPINPTGKSQIVAVEKNWLKAAEFTTDLLCDGRQISWQDAWVYPGFFCAFSKKLDWKKTSILRTNSIFLPDSGSKQAKRDFHSFLASFDI